jgi:hypothetical protein
MPWEPQAEYLRGLVGVYADPEATDRLNAMLFAQGQSPDGSEICQRYGLFGSGAGKLSAPFAVIERVFPGSLPASAQQVGDCVAHSTRNACLGTLACEIHAGLPDEVTNEIEGVPDVSEAARKDGVLSTEAIYWWRNHGGADGWNCDHAAEMVLKNSGLWLRRNYPDIGIDLTRYTRANQVRWGRPLPPDNIRRIGQEHLVRTATHAKTFEEVRDLLHNGYCISSCGMEAFSNRRDDNGVSKRSSSTWAHAMAYLGVDDRETTKARYGEPLVMVQNSWGRWNTGGRKVLNSVLEIPEGGFWARWSDLQRRYCVAFSGVMGWPAQTLPDWGLGDVL